MSSPLGVVEKKVLGAMLILANEDMEVRCRLKDIADKMGYAAVGGAMTFAIRLLETHNYIRIIGKQHYQVLL